MVLLRFPYLRSRPFVVFGFSYCETLCSPTSLPSFAFAALVLALADPSSPRCCLALLLVLVSRLSTLSSESCSFFRAHSLSLMAPWSVLAIRRVPLPWARLRVSLSLSLCSFIMTLLLSPSLPSSLPLALAPSRFYRFSPSRLPLLSSFLASLLRHLRAASFLALTSAHQPRPLPSQSQPPRKGVSCSLYCHLCSSSLPPFTVAFALLPTRLLCALLLPLTRLAYEIAQEALQRPVASTKRRTSNESSSSDSSRPSDELHSKTRFVGRQEELKKLGGITKDLWNRSKNSPEDLEVETMRSILVTGISGIGIILSLSPPSLPPPPPPPARARALLCGLADDD